MLRNPFLTSTCGEFLPVDLFLHLDLRRLAVGHHCSPEEKDNSNLDPCPVQPLSTNLPVEVMLQESLALAQRLLADWLGR